MAVITEGTLRAMWKRGIPNPFPLAKEEKLTPAAADFLKGRGISVKPLEQKGVSEESNFAEQSLSIVAGVSNRHIHLSQEHVEQLFGQGYMLTPLRPLSQPGQFAANEQVTLVGAKGTISNVRILGPSRGATQVEISRTDGFTLGIHPPVRLSGAIDGTPGVAVIGPKGCVVLEQGVIIAKCHVHMSTDDASTFGVQHGDHLMLLTGGERPVLFPEVAVRVSPQYRLDFHIDLDEANAANLRTGDTVSVAGVNGRLTRGLAR